MADSSIGKREDKTLGQQLQECIANAMPPCGMLGDVIRWDDFDAAGQQVYEKAAAAFLEGWRPEDSSSRDHAQTIGSALEEELSDVADGLRLFSLEKQNNGYGRHLFVPPYEFALRIEAAISSAKQVDGESSRDELAPSPNPNHPAIWRGRG